MSPRSRNCLAQRHILFQGLNKTGREQAPFAFVMSGIAPGVWGCVINVGNLFAFLKDQPTAVGLFRLVVPFCGCPQR